MLALAAIPAVRLRRRRGRLQPRRSARTAMQAALDATALMLSKDAQTPRRRADLKRQGERRISRRFSTARKPKRPVHPAVQPRRSRAASSLKLTGSATVNTHVHDAARPARNSTVSATREVLWGIKKLNLALALDNTGSMASSAKMTNAEDGRAQSAHHAQERRQRRRATSRSSIVPFATDVNVGTGNVNAHLDRLDATGTPPTASAATTTTTPRAVASRNGKTWTPEAAQHLERLRQGSRPEQRRDQHADRLPARRRRCSAPTRPRTARPR